jgi:hypothetical protein
MTESPSHVEELVPAETKTFAGKDNKPDEIFEKEPL